jgi:hypothetical protein
MSARTALRLRRQAITTILAVVILGTGVPAAGDTARYRDPEDTVGRLDVAVLKHRHSTDGTMLKHVVRTREGWSKRQFRRRGTLRLVFSLSGDSCAEAEVVVDVAHAKWRGRWRGYDPLGCGPEDDSGGWGEFYGRIEVRKPAADRIVIGVPRRRFGSRGYLWAVTTTWTCKEPCGDDAPDRENADRAVIRHRL